ncbi:MAG: hypothetical protein RL065_555, partial [Bacteroidota bacterium]
MKVRSKLMILLSACLLAFCGIVYYFNQIIIGNTKMLLKQRGAETQNEFAMLLETTLKPAKTFVNDKAQWIDLNEFKENKTDSKLINPKLTETSNQIGFQYLSIVDNNFEKLYSAYLPDNKTKGLNLTKTDLTKNLNTSQDVQFYIHQNHQLLRVVASPIIDKANSKTNGYLLAAEIIDENKLKSWEKLLSNIELSFDKSESLSNENELEYNLQKGEVSFGMSFIDANQNSIAKIKVVKNSNIYSAFAADFQKYLTWFILGCIGLAALSLFYFVVWVNLPLQKIAAALNRGDISAIEHLEKSNSEFGDLSRVVKNSFIQKQNLLNEIETRKLTVEALKKAITDMNVAQQDKQKAERADIAKSLFLSTMSHEIRTPINGVIGIANLLLSEHPTPSQERYIKLLEFSAKHLKLLVDDILDFSKIEAGKFEFSKIEFNMNSLFNDIFSTNQLRANEKGIE